MKSIFSTDCMWFSHYMTYVFFHSRLGELEALMDRVENTSKAHQESVSIQLQDKDAEVSALRTDNERLKVELHELLSSACLIVYCAVYL